MEIKKFEYEDRTKYYIVFGSETFWVKESKKMEYKSSFNNVEYLVNGSWNYNDS